MNYCAACGNVGKLIIGFCSMSCAHRGTKSRVTVSQQLLDRLSEEIFRITTELDRARQLLVEKLQHGEG